MEQGGKGSGRASWRRQGLGGALKVEEVGVERGRRASQEGGYEECREGEASALAGLMQGAGPGNLHVPQASPCPVILMQVV